jgi:hypothetical protein
MRTTMKTTMKTTMTLGEIRACGPCADGWKKLIAACGTSADDHVVDLRDILRSNGPCGAWWATRCLPQRERVAMALLAAMTLEHSSAEAASVGADAAWSVAARAAAVAARAALAEADAAWSAGAWSAGAWAAWAAAASAKADAWASLGEILRQWCDEQED